MTSLRDSRLRRAGTRLARGTTLAGAGWAVRHWSSPAVRGWSPPHAGTFRRAGDLVVRDSGGEGPVLVALHGLIASGDVFGGGFDPLAAGFRLVVPDLLGFGRSLGAGHDDYSLQAHMGALDRMLEALDLQRRPLTVVGHSMGAVLALHWAARRPETRAVMTLCAPLYTSPEEASERIRSMGLFERWFALEGPAARTVCGWMCAHRHAAGVLAAVLQPQWPVPTARRGVQHNWASYLGGMNGIIRHGGWEPAIAALDRRGVDVLLAGGARDPVPVAGRDRELAESYACVRTALHPVAGHDLPHRDPGWCVGHVPR